MNELPQAGILAYQHEPWLLLELFVAGKSEPSLQPVTTNHNIHARDNNIQGTTIGL